MASEVEHKVRTGSGRKIVVREKDGMFQQIGADGKPVGRERTSMGKVKRRA